MVIRLQSMLRRHGEPFFVFSTGLLVPATAMAAALCCMHVLMQHKHKTSCKLLLKLFVQLGPPCMVSTQAVRQLLLDLSDACLVL